MYKMVFVQGLCPSLGDSDCFCNLIAPGVTDGDCLQADRARIIGICLTLKFSQLQAEFEVQQATLKELDNKTRAHGQYSPEGICQLGAGHQCVEVQTYLRRYIDLLKVSRILQKETKRNVCVSLSFKVP